MHDSDYEAMMRKGRSTALPILAPAQTVKMCSKKIPAKRVRAVNTTHKMRLEQKMEKTLINNTYFKW